MQPGEPEPEAVDLSHAHVAAAHGLHGLQKRQQELRTELRQKLQGPQEIMQKSKAALILLTDVFLRQKEQDSVPFSRHVYIATPEFLGDGTCDEEEGVHVREMSSMTAGMARASLESRRAQRVLVQALANVALQATEAPSAVVTPEIVWNTVQPRLQRLLERGSGVAAVSSMSRPRYQVSAGRQPNQLANVYLAPNDSLWRRCAQTWRDASILVKKIQEPYKDELKLLREHEAKLRLELLETYGEALMEDGIVPVSTGSALHLYLEKRHVPPVTPEEDEDQDQASSNMENEEDEANEVNGVNEETSEGNRRTEAPAETPPHKLLLLKQLQKQILKYPPLRLQYLLQDGDPEEFEGWAETLISLAVQESQRALLPQTQDAETTKKEHEKNSPKVGTVPPIMTLLLPR
jgi:hypothetical protein